MIEQGKLAKVIEGLDACLEGLCEACSYRDVDAPGGCKDALMYDAFALLKAQEPKIGHWVDKCCRDFHCSECNHKLIDNRWIHADGYCYDDLPKYCPECGVKMGRGIIQMRFAGEDKIVYPDYEKRAK